MTKLRNISQSDRFEEPEKGSGLAQAAFAILIAGLATLGLIAANARAGQTISKFATQLSDGWHEGLANFASEASSKPLTSIAMDWSDDWRRSISDAPHVLTTLRLGDWPMSLFARHEGTRHMDQTPLLATNKPMIAIVIDDLGADEEHTRDAMALPAAVTLSFLPYAPASAGLSHTAHLAGHEVIVHLPMQPVGTENPGPNALVAGLSTAETRRRVDWALSRVRDFDGVNNHMGSKLTASRTSLVPVMEELSDHGMFFLDSRTTPNTLAENVARQAGMLTGSRDVFLDNDEDAPAVERQLKLAEAHAREHGTAIAIGHPHPETLKALAEWTKTLEARGFTLVTVKQALQVRSVEKRQRVSSLD